MCWGYFFFQLPLGGSTPVQSFMLASKTERFWCFAALLTTYSENSCRDSAMTGEWWNVTECCQLGSWWSVNRRSGPATWWLDHYRPTQPPWDKADRGDVVIWSSCRLPDCWSVPDDPQHNNQSINQSINHRLFESTAGKYSNKINMWNSVQRERNANRWH